MPHYVYTLGADRVAHAFIDPMSTVHYAWDDIADADAHAKMASLHTGRPAFVSQNPNQDGLVDGKLDTMLPTDMRVEKPLPAGVSPFYFAENEARSKIFLFRRYPTIHEDPNVNAVIGEIAYRDSSHRLDIHRIVQHHQNGLVTCYEVMKAFDVAVLDEMLQGYVSTCPVTGLSFK